MISASLFPLPLPPPPLPPPPRERASDGVLFIIIFLFCALGTACFIHAILGPLSCLIWAPSNSRRAPRDAPQAISRLHRAFTPILGGHIADSNGTDALRCVPLFPSPAPLLSSSGSPGDSDRGVRTLARTEPIARESGFVPQGMGSRMPGLMPLLLGGTLCALPVCLRRQ